MKQRLLLLFLLLGSWLGLRPAQAQTTTIARESFESATSPANSASSFGYTSFDQNYFDDRANTVQFFQRSSLPVSGFNTANGFVFGTGIDGSWLVAGEAVRGQVGGAPDRAARYVQLNGINIAGKSSIQVLVSFADARGLGSGATIGQGTNNWENDDFVRIKARVNGGAWVVIGQLVGDNPTGGGGGRLRQDTNLNGISSDDLSAPAVGSSFQDFTFNLTGSGSTLDVMVEVDANGGSEELALDNIRVLGTQSATAPPVLANIETTSLNYNEGDPATIITNTVTVSDADSPNLTGGSVTLTTGFVSAQDRLVFVNQGGISGVYNTGNGVLTLSGTASLAAYQAALRSVRYQNIQTVTAIGGLRLATFTVTDGTATSAVSRDIIVNAQLNAPATLPYLEDFETDGEGLRYATDTWSTSNPCLGFLRTNQNPYTCTPVTFGNISNSYYWYSEGTSNPANPNPVDLGTMTLAPVNASSYNNLHFNIRLGTGQSAQWENDDYAKFYYRVNGGAWVLFAAFYGNGASTAASGELQRDTNLDGVADGVILNSTLQNVDLALPPAVTGASVDFQIIISSDGQEELAFDRINITGAQLVAPTVTTGTAGSITGTTASISNSTLSSDGGAGLTGYGIVYVAGTGTPTLSNSVLTAGTSSPSSFPANFSVNLSSLTPGTTYTARAYATNSVGTSYGANVTFTTQTTVTSIVPASANPTNATTVTFTVTFATSVSGLTTSNFTTANGGSVTGSSVTGLTPVSGTVYTVTVNTGSGSGTLGLTLANDTGLAPSVSNEPFTGTPLYTIDKTAPTAVITRQTPTSTTTNATSVVFRVTFSEAVTGVGTGSFTLNTTGTAAGTLASATSVGGSTTVYDVVVSGVSGNGTLGITLKSTGSGVTDQAGNAPTGTTGPTYTIDQTAPTVTALTTTAGTSGTTTTTTPFNFTVTFSEAVSGFATSGIAVTNGSVTSGPAGTSPGTTFTFTVTPTTAGTATTVAIAANAAQDAAGNGNIVSSTYSLTYNLPSATVTSIARQTPTAAATATATVTYLVTFSAPVSGVTANNFSLTTTGVSGASITGVSPGTGSSATYTVTANTGTGNGTLQLNVANATGITPSVTNTPFAGTSAVYTITKSFAAAPTLRIQAAGSASGNSDVTAFVDVVQVLQSGTNTVVANGLQNGSFESNNVSPSNYLYPNSSPPVVAAPWSFGTQAGVSRNNSAFGSTAYSGDAVAFLQSTGGNNGSVTQNLAVPTGTYQVSFQAAQRNYTSIDQRLDVFVNDVFVGNIQPNNIPTYDTFTSATFSVTAPALTATVSTTSGSPTSTSPIPFSVSFSQSVGTTFTASDLAGTITNGTVTSGSFSGSGSGPYTFTVTPSGAGTVTVSLAAGVANDANNTLNTTSNSVSVQYQLLVTAAPVLTSPANNSTTNSLPTFAGTAPTGSTVTVYLAMGSNAAQVIGTTTATSGSFSFTPATALTSGSYSAYATAQSSGSAVSANSNTNTFIVDVTAPTVLSINRQNPTAATTNATSLTFRVTFSESVTGVDATDFTLTTTAGTVTSSSRTVTAVSASVYDVTVSGLSGNGTVRLDLNASGTGIADLATNPIGGGYTGGQTYTLDQTAPVATISSSAGISGSTTTTTPIPFTITFSEGVTGFSAAGISVTNGTLNGFTSASATIYTFTVTPTTAGTATTVSVLTNAAQDAAGNGNAATASFSITYLAPVTLTTWTGAVNTNWFNGGNWTAGVPGSTLDAVIPAGAPRYPILNAAGTASMRSLTLNSGATLTQIDGTLDVRGDLTVNGTFVTTNAAGTAGGTVSMGQTARANGPNILGSTAVRFWNLSVQANGLLLSTSAGTSVQNILTLNGGFATQNNPFTLESTPTITALVVNNGSNVVTGNVTVQRAIDPSLNSGPGYRHYSAPVNSSTVSDLSTPTGFAPVVNPAYNTAANPGSVIPFPNVFGYDEQRVNLTNSLSAFDRGYVSPTSTGNALTVGRGYTVNIGAGQVVDFVGSLNNGPLPVSLTSTRDTNPDGGWQLLGNPYPAPLDYRLVAETDRPGLDAAIYVFSSTSQYGGQYRSFVNGFGNPVLPVGQGFFTRVSTMRTSASMTFQNTQRLTTPDATTLQRLAETRPVVQLTLQGTSSPLTDELYVYFEQGATDSFDRAFDAEKLSNPSGLNLSSSLSASQRLSTDGRAPLGTAQQVVPLAVGVPAAGTYSLAVAQLLNLTTVPVYLRDRQTGALIDLAQQPRYQFAVSNASALITGRFELVFSPQQPLATVPVALAQQVLVYPNPAKGQVAIELPLPLGGQPVTATLVDAVGRPVREQVLPAGRVSHTLLLTDLATGVYALRLRTELGTVVRKLVVE